MEHVPANVFGEDYLYFYEEWLDDELSDAQAELIWDLLGLSEGDEVLDVPCGHGRIANRLAGRGARVTGVDADTFFLEHARTDAAARGVEVDYVQGDMRELPWSERFDAALNWFTSFGYFDDEGNRAWLGTVHRTLKGRWAARDRRPQPRRLHAQPHQRIGVRAQQQPGRRQPQLRRRDGARGDGALADPRRTAAEDGLLGSLLHVHGAARPAPRRRLLLGRGDRPRPEAAHAREPAHGRHRASLTRASPRRTWVNAFPRRARFAWSLSQPLAPDGCGSGITIASSRMKLLPIASVSRGSPSIRFRASPPTVTIRSGRSSSSSQSRQNWHRSCSRGVGLRSPRPERARPG